VATFDLMDELVPPGGTTAHRIYYTLGFRLFRGTRLYELALREGKVRAGDNLAVPRFYLADSLMDDAVLELIEERVTANDSAYLWWGLPATPLAERVRAVSERYREFDELYAARLGHGPEGGA
jgi:hypothetical protein